MTKRIFMKTSKLFISECRSDAFCYSDHRTWGELQPLKRILPGQLPVRLDSSDPYLDYIPIMYKTTRRALQRWVLINVAVS